MKFWKWLVKWRVKLETDSFNWLVSWFCKVVPEEIDIPEPEYISPIDKQEVLQNGRHAEALLSDPLLNAAFEAIAQKYRSEWENAARDDLETQRNAHLAISALKDLQQQLRNHVGKAKLRQFDLAERQKRDARNQY